MTTNNTTNIPNYIYDVSTIGTSPNSDYFFGDPLNTVISPNTTNPYINVAPITTTSWITSGAAITMTAYDYDIPLPDGRTIKVSEIFKTVEELSVQVADLQKVLNYAMSTIKKLTGQKTKKKQLLND